uniref:Uncharacterized protein n=1 Tax=viral metagenome TaxID=1070528 RepID=A0A6C0LQ93_9ZZZZ
MASVVPQSLIQLCTSHPDRTFSVDKSHKSGIQNQALDTQDKAPRWGLTTYTLEPRHPLSIWLTFKDPLYRVSPPPLRQRLLLDATTEWQQRCETLDFPRNYGRKKALEGFGSIKPERDQARAALIAMERYVSADQALLWILWNDTNKKLSFLDDKAFPRETGYTTIWIMREPMMDQVWDASTWSPSHLVQWIQDQERAGFDVEWPQPHPSTSVKTLSAEYTAMGLNPAGLSKDDLRKKVGRAKAIKVLGQV